MAAEKRPAPEGLGASQIVKRQRPESGLGSHSALTLSNGTARNGAVALSVSHILMFRYTEGAKYLEKELDADQDDVYRDCILEQDLHRYWS